MILEILYNLSATTIVTLPRYKPVLCFLQGGKNPGEESIYGDIGSYAPTYNGKGGAGREGHRRDHAPRRDKDGSVLGSLASSELHGICLAHYILLILK